MSKEVCIYKVHSKMSRATTLSLFNCIQEKKRSVVRKCTKCKLILPTYFLLPKKILHFFQKIYIPSYLPDNVRTILPFLK